jgi:hypothetical protein
MPAIIVNEQSNNDITIKVGQCRHCNDYIIEKWGIVIEKAISSKEINFHNNSLDLFCFPLEKV